MTFIPELKRLMAKAKMPSVEGCIGEIDLSDLLINSAPALAELVEAMQQIDDTPCSMVNDSESLRHTIKTIKYYSRKALAKLNGGKHEG